MMKCVTDFGIYDVEIEVASYRNNSNLAILLNSPTEGPFATLTVNLGELEEGYAFVDMNNCPWAETFIRENELGEFTGTSRLSGYCVYPLYKFDMSKLEEYRV